MILLRKFNRRSTVIRLQHFGNPKITSSSELELPRGSIYHFPTQLESITGPAQSHPIISKAEKITQMRFHTYLDAPIIQGRPIEKTVALNAEVVRYLRINKRIRLMKDPILINKDERTLLVENYALLNQRYRYGKGVFAWYDQWHNEFATIINGIKKATEEFPNRQNYIELHMADVVPAINKFRRAEFKRDVNTTKEFTNLQNLFLLELWTWLGSARERSLIDIIPQESLKRVNIIISFNGKFFNLNLGELDFWRKNGNQGKVEPIQMQKRLYRSCVILATTAAQESEDAIKVKETDARNESELNDYEDVEQPEVPEELDEEMELETDEEIERFDATDEINEDEDIEVVQTSKSGLEEQIDFNNSLTLSEGIDKEMKQYVDAGVMTAKRFDYLNSIKDEYKNIPNPYGDGTLDDMTEVTEDDVKLEPEATYDDITLIDKSMAKSTLVNIRSNYNEKVLPKDMVNSVLSLQKAGFVVTDYNTEVIIDAANQMLLHKVKVVPVDGEPSTITFTTPIVDERGYWTANNITYTQKAQRIDVPIRKTAPDTVTLTSFYGKNFIRRSERKANDFGGWLTNNIILVGRDVKDESITSLQFNNVFNNELRLPRDYSMVSMRISSFNSQGYHFNFDISKVEDIFSKEVVNELAETKLTPVAKSKSDILVMDERSQLYRKDETGMNAAGRLHEYLGIVGKVPKEFSELSLMGKTIPLAIIFAYYLGLENMLKFFKVKYSIVDRSERVTGLEADLVIPCRDGKYVIYYSDNEHELLLNGWLGYLKVTKEFSVSDFNNKDVYLPLIQKDGLTLRYLDELTLMDDMFVDPITERILKKMKEPLTFKGLLQRSNELLTTDWHPHEMSADYQHLFTTQRIPGAVYTNMVRATREFRRKSTSRRKLELAPRDVWNSITEDGAVMPASDANPIHSIKENSVVTLGGTGGRSRRSMVKHTREYNESDIGWISGDTVDSGDVAITAYMSNNPTIGDVDGGRLGTEFKDLDNSNILSLPILLAPGSMYDDPKRRNFVGIQSGSATFAEGYQVTPYRTGAEKLVAHMTNSTQAVVSKQPGTVLEVTKNGVTVEYDDGSVVSYPLGKSFGTHEGGTYPRDTKSNVKAGDKIPAGCVLTYNSKYFEPDFYNPTQVNYKGGVIANVAFIEGVDTWEDSSAISENLSKKFRTEVTKVKSIFVNFEQAVSKLVKNGDKVDDDSILCIIEDELTASTGMFNDESLATLRNMAAHVPKAKVNGVIDHIEVFYNGDFEDMSDSVRAIAEMGDKIRLKQAKSSPTPIASTGRVDSSLRIDGIPVELDTLVIRIYITHSANAIGGDKFVLANQMKSTFRRVYIGKNETLSGEPFDVIFGRTGIDNRMVNSVYRMGTSIKFAELLTNHVKGMLSSNK